MRSLTSILHFGRSVENKHRSEGHSRNYGHSGEATERHCGFYRSGTQVLILTAGVSLMSVGASAQMSNSETMGNYEKRCTSCHETPLAGSHAPSRAILRQMPPSVIFEALTTGKMAVHAQGLTVDQRRGIAEFVTGKPIGVIDRSAAAMSNRCSAESRLENPLAGPKWNGWSPDPTTNARFQSARDAGLLADDVHKLKLKWAFGFPGASTFRSQPTVAGGWLWVGSDNGMVYALDARTGCVHWSFEAKRPILTAVSIGTMKNSPRHYVAYFGDHGANVYAVDAETGKLLWTRHVDQHPGAIITGSVTLDAEDGRLVVPVGSWEEVSGEAIYYECCTFRGSVVALEARTGRQLWKTYTISRPPRPLWVNKAGKRMYGPSGSGVWVTPTLDLKRRAVYVGTSNAYNTEPDGGTSDAFFAFDLDTGVLLWHRQATADDWDLNGCGDTEADRAKYCPGKHAGPNDDVPASPILHTLANGRQVVIGAQESRRITVLDPDHRGQLVWQKTPSDRPPSTSGNLGPADDGHLLYVPLAYLEGDVPPNGDDQRLAPEGGLTALEPETGQRVWTTLLPKPTDCPDPKSQWCSSGNQAAVTAIPGAVFTGSVDGTLRAFSAQNGKVLWSFKTNRDFTTVNGVKASGGTIGGPGPTVVDGMVYAGSGYTIVGNMPGNVLLAFGVH